MKLFVITIWSLLITTLGYGQRLPDADLYKVRISDAGHALVFETAPVNSAPKLFADKTYHWYSANVIHITQGGYSGKLLNGYYNEYYPNKNLKQQGSFKKGLKDATWKSWDENGVLLESITWEKGEKSGDFQLFDEQGHLKQSGYYKNGLLNGKVIDYDAAGKQTVVVYADGKIIQPKTPFFKRIHLFKKKAATTKP